MTKVEFLNELAKTWFGNSRQHSIHAQLLKARGLNKLADKIMEESNEEWEEAKQVNARLIELGEKPCNESEDYPIITDIKEMLEFDLKDAAESIPEASKALALFDDDYVTRHMIEGFILEEQEHLNWVKGHLAMIEQIGMENYLIEMLG